MWAAGLSLCLAAALVVTVVLVRDGRHEVEPRTVDVPRASPAEATEALAALVSGIEERRSADLAALAPDGDTAAVETLDAVATNAAALDLVEVGARYVEQAGTVAPDGSWTGDVELTWQIAGVDRAPAEADVRVRFAPAGGALGIAGFAAGDGARVPLWLQGELAVSRTGDALVMVGGAAADTDEVAARVERGIDVVRRVLPRWSGPAVVEVPASARALDEALGVEPGTYAQIAAVTAFVGEASEGAPVHVFVNPDVTSGLRPAGAQVVMSHELTHLATDAAGSGVAPWLLEGFADYVALRDTGLPDATTLGRVLAAVRREGLPRGLPGAAAFDTRADDLQAAYEGAWLACRIIAERLGERGLVAVYDATGAGAPLERALRRAGLPLGQLTAAWREQLWDLAG